MKRNFVSYLLSFIFIFFLSALSFQLSAYSVPVENVFSDITKDYKYYNELQTLYDKGMIFPDSEGKFNPKKLLNRDEYVGIMMEVSCTKCISPNVDYNLIERYSETPLFFDISKNNKYYYCIADAENKRYVVGYQAGTTCENGTRSTNEAPFCPNNTIILEEALAVILRASGILTNYEAELIRQKIASGEITSNLSDDVSPKNIDGSVYSFYPDFLRALEYELVEIDKDGNEKVYHLVQKSADNKLRPKQPITKEDFLYIAYVALKANVCVEKVDYYIGLEIEIFPRTCNENIINTCSISKLDGDEKVYDFNAKVELPENDSITNSNQYIWRFYSYCTGEEIKKYGKYIDNYDFLKNGKYRVYLRVISDSGQTGEVYNDINIGNGKCEESDRGSDGKKVSINANPISGDAPLMVDFEGIVSGGSNNNSFFWSFGDGETGFGKNINHLYKEPGVYEVVLTVTDSDGFIDNASVLIYVSGKGECLDYDNDGVNDCEDACPTVPGPKENKGCPIFDLSCKTDADCPEGYYCNYGVCTPKQVATNCEYSGGDLITGNVVCNSCPCANSVDFCSNVRKCDVVFPAIVSPDGSTIYSRGNYFEVR